MEFTPKPVDEIVGQLEAGYRLALKAAKQTHGKQDRGDAVHAVKEAARGRADSRLDHRP